jgi:type VI secretion system secreted protein Hcp
MPTLKRTKPALPPFTRPLLAGALAATALSAIDAQAAIFLKITGPEIKGESTNAKHKDEIVVTSFSQGYAATIAAGGGGGARAGRSACAPVEMTKQLDIASGPLINTVMKGTVLQKAVFSFTANTGDNQPADYYVVTLSNSLVSSVAQSSGGDRPSESVELVPRQVELKYLQQDNKTGAFVVANTTVVDCTSIKGQ